MNIILCMLCMCFNVNIKFKGYKHYKCNRIFIYRINSLFLTNWYLCRLGGGSVPIYYLYIRTKSYSISMVPTMHVLLGYLCRLGVGSVPRLNMYCWNLI